MFKHIILISIITGISVLNTLQSSVISASWTSDYESKIQDSLQNEYVFGMRYRSVPKEADKIKEPVYLKQSPGNEATVVNSSNGDIKIFFVNRPGKADRMMSVTSSDNGMNWSDPIEEFALPGEAYYANNLVKDNKGELHCVFHIFGTGENGYRGRHLDLWYCKTEKNGKQWSKPKKIYYGYVGSIRGFILLKNNRLLLVFARSVPELSVKPLPGITDYGWNEIISMFSDDNGNTWQTSDNGIKIQVDSSQVTRYGGVEPSVIELNDNKVWMLIRTNKGHLYESFSANSGKTWTSPSATKYISSDSPATLLRLKDNRLIILWSGNQRWDDQRSYANGGREVLHAAISGNDGKSWRGFREILVSPAGHFIIKRDIGTAYPSAVETDDGKILFVSGQAEERAIVMFDPDWLEAKSAKDNFLKGLSQWTLFGADSNTCLRSLPSERAREALLIRKSLNSRNHDTEAVWNFPLTTKGKIVIEIVKNPGYKGINLALTDHFSVSYDTLASENSIVNISLKNEMQLNTPTESKIIILWDSNKKEASCYNNNTLLKIVPFQRSSLTGINYLRAGIPGSDADLAGYYIQSVKLVMGE